MPLTGSFVTMLLTGALAPANSCSFRIVSVTVLMLMPLSIWGGAVQVHTFAASGWPAPTFAPTNGGDLGRREEGTRERCGKCRASGPENQGDRVFRKHA